MESSSSLPRQGRRLLQLGVCLLLFASFEGFAIPYFAVTTRIEPTGLRSARVRLQSGDTSHDLVVLHVKRTQLRPEADRSGSDEGIEQP